MQRWLSAALAALFAILQLGSVAAAAALLPAGSTSIRGLSDPADAVPAVEEVRAALTIFGAPRINDHDLPDDDALWDLFDEAGRYVVVPAGDMNEVTFVVGAYNIDEGTNEAQDYGATLNLLRTYATKRVGAGKFDMKPQSGDDLFGANEAHDVPMVAMDGASVKNVMLVRIARFGKTVVVVTADTSPKTGQVTDELMLNLALPWVTIAKMVSDKTK